MSETSERIAALAPLLDDWLRFQQWYREIPSLAVGISVGGETVYAGVHGMADVERGTTATVDTRYRIASHSKVFTATAVMALFARGALRLDDAVSEHVPWFRSSKNTELESVTIRQLLSHSGGITRDGTTTHWFEDRFPDLDEIVAQVDEVVPVFGPVEKLKYSNIGFTLLGQVIESVTAQPYETHVADTLLTPLGLSHTTPDLPDDMAEHATGYTMRLPGRPRLPVAHIRAGVMNSATGFSSTVGDLLRWYQAHLVGSGDLFEDRHKREMQRVQFEGGGMRWGLGFQLASHGGLDFSSHGGGYPGFITYSGVNQKHEMAIVVLTSTIDGPARELFAGIANLVKKSVDGDFEAEVGPDASGVAGFYENRWSIEQVAQVGSKLAVIAPTALDPAASLQMLDHIEGLRFRLPDNLPTGSPGEEVWFEPGDPPILHAPAVPPTERSLPWDFPGPR